MVDSWIFFLVITLLFLLSHGMCSMFEMASVSFNKVRLQYYMSKNERRARWLSYLLTHPAQLFGTTLIGVNVALLLGSESSRRFYESLNLNPDWAPLTQILLVMIFAELSPMLAGRRHAEHVALLLVPLFYWVSRILLPLIWLVDLLCQLVNRLVGSPTTKRLYLSREELQSLIEERDEMRETSTIVGNIFSLKSKVAKELMTPLPLVQTIPSFCSVSELRRLLTINYSPFVPIYHRHPQNIVSIAYPRDLLRIPDHAQVREHGRSVWFITEGASILQILKQFRSNNQSIAVVLGKGGGATGVLTLDAIVDEIFGLTKEPSSSESSAASDVFVERTFPAEMSVKAFNQKYRANLPLEDEDETLGELTSRLIGHIPSQGEVVRLEDFELVVEEATLLGPKALLIRSIT